MLTVTTSWDDGDVLDSKLAELLDRYGVKGTFYVTKQYRQERLSEDGIRALGERHEIGAHTLTHPDLRSLSSAQKRAEIEGGKQWLEEVLGKEVPMFCYPAGHFDAETKALVQEAGYKGARTTAFGILEPSPDFFEMPTTVGVYPMPFRKIDKKRYYWGKLLQPYTERATTMRRMGVPLTAFRSFEALARASFDIALRKGGVFHLWGHSWEIERYGMWEPLEAVLGYIGNMKECQYLTNGDVIKSL